MTSKKGIAPIGRHTCGNSSCDCGIGYLRQARFLNLRVRLIGVTQ